MTDEALEVIVLETILDSQKNAIHIIPHLIAKIKDWKPGITLKVIHLKHPKAKKVELQKALDTMRDNGDLVLIRGRYMTVDFGEAVRDIIEGKNSE